MKEISPWRVQQVSDPLPAEPVYNPHVEEAHLRDYWKVVVKYRRLILIIFWSYLDSARILSRAQRRCTWQPQR